MRITIEAIEQLKVARKILTRLKEESATRDIIFLEEIRNKRIEFALWVAKDQATFNEAQKWPMFELWRLIDSLITDSSAIQNLKAFRNAGHDPITLQK